MRRTTTFKTLMMRWLCLRIPIEISWIPLCCASMQSVACGFLVVASLLLGKATSELKSRLSTHTIWKTWCLNEKIIRVGVAKGRLQEPWHLLEGVHPWNMEQVWFLYSYPRILYPCDSTYAGMNLMQRHWRRHNACSSLNAGITAGKHWMVHSAECEIISCKTTSSINYFIARRLFPNKIKYVVLL